MNTAVIFQLGALEKIYQNELEDTFLATAINKIVDYEINKTQKDVMLLNNDLQKIENRFKMDSSTFFKKWESGEMGDDADFFEWSALYQMFLRAKKRLDLLGVQ
ncbi:MAG: hypothetical protein ABH886_10055 [Candidatus Desantisbacteria bacterium]